MMDESAGYVLEGTLRGSTGHSLVTAVAVLRIAIANQHYVHPISKHKQYANIWVSKRHQNLRKTKTHGFVEI
jgi:hypothetical protein